MSTKIYTKLTVNNIRRHQRYDKKHEQKFHNSGESVEKNIIGLDIWYKVQLIDFCGCPSKDKTLHHKTTQDLARDTLLKRSYFSSSFSGSVF